MNDQKFKTTIKVWFNVYLSDFWFSSIENWRWGDWNSTRECRNLKLCVDWKLDEDIGTNDQPEIFTESEIFNDSNPKSLDESDPWTI